MFEAIKAQAERAVLERAVLFVNHVIRAEPAAMVRLQAHAGRTVAVEWTRWPALLPAPSVLVVRITAAGLAERLDDAIVAAVITAPDVRLVVDAANPAMLATRWATGDRSGIEVAGEPGLAADVRWLLDHLRWDARDDLARVIGDAPAEQVARAGDRLSAALREGAATIRARAAEWRRP